MSELSVYRKFERLFIKSYKEEPNSLFCKSVVTVSPFVRPFKRIIRNHKQRHSFKKVLQTHPMACNSLAETEVHTLVSYHHVFMYLVAIKSFLRYCPDVAVVVHDDGTLTSLDKDLLQRHIQGIKVIDRRVADRQIGDILKSYPHATRFRGNIMSALELFDYFLLAQKEKLIGINSDVLFLNKPQSMLEWISTSHKNLISCYEESPLRQKEFLDEFNCHFPPHLCLAVICFYKRVFDLDLIEKVLKRADPFWLSYWCTAQNIYPILFQNKADEYESSFFDKMTYQASCVFEDDVIFRHYQNTNFLRWFDLHFKDADKVMRRL